MSSLQSFKKIPFREKSVLFSDSEKNAGDRRVADGRWRADTADVSGPGRHTGQGGADTSDTGGPGQSRAQGATFVRHQFRSATK